MAIIKNMEYLNLPDGYRETIDKGIRGLRSFRPEITRAPGTREENIERLRREINEADAIVVGAGAGMSEAAGLHMGGERFYEYFPDFIRKYGFRDMYSGGFGPFESVEEEWGFWARFIYVACHLDIPKPALTNLRKILEGKDYFVITTNGDHSFQRSGYDKKRLFYTQGELTLFQSENRKNQKTYDNDEWVMQALEAQGLVKGEDGFYHLPEDREPKMAIPTELIPMCEDGYKMKMNVRGDETFVEDEGWHKASAAYAEFLHRVEGKHVLFLEIGVGMNTPVIIKYPFWVMTNENKNAVYACLNYSEAYCPKQIEDQSICINGDTGEVLEALLP